MVTNADGKCEICRRPFPAHLLHPLIGNDIECSHACPVCSLAYIREAHSDPKFMFKDNDNLQRYLEAMEIVKDDTDSYKDKPDTSTSSG